YEGEASQRVFVLPPALSGSAALVPFFRTGATRLLLTQVLTHVVCFPRLSLGGFQLQGHLVPFFEVLNRVWREVDLRSALVGLHLDFSAVVIDLTDRPLHHRLVGAPFVVGEGCRGEPPGE